MFSQVDDNSYRYQLIDHIISHRNDNIAMRCGDECIVVNNGNKSRKYTTKGQYFEVRWKDGTTSWVPLKEIKENHPIETEKYTNFAVIIHEPALAW